jgi:hypothetical protein
MRQLKERGHAEAPPPIATDGKGAYLEAMVETWGEVPPPPERGRRPVHKQPEAGWHYLQVVKHREGGHLVQVEIEVIYGDETTLDLVGANTSYVERTNLTSRQMNGRLVRKTLSFSKNLELLKAASAWEDGVYNLTRTVKTLRVETDQPGRRYELRSASHGCRLDGSRVDYQRTVDDGSGPYPINSGRVDHRTSRLMLWAMACVLS